jgi:hypothetical protein
MPCAHCFLTSKAPHHPTPPKPAPRSPEGQAFFFEFHPLSSHRMPPAPSPKQERGSGLALCFSHRKPPSAPMDKLPFVHWLFRRPIRHPTLFGRMTPTSKSARKTSCRMNSLCSLSFSFKRSPRAPFWHSDAKIGILSQAVLIGVCAPPYLSAHK